MPITDETRLIMEAHLFYEGGPFEGFLMIEEETQDVLVHQTFFSFRDYLENIIMKDKWGWANNPYFQFNSQSLYLQQSSLYRHYSLSFWENYYANLPLEDKVDYLVDEHVFLERLRQGNVEFL